MNLIKQRWSFIKSDHLFLCLIKVTLTIFLILFSASSFQCQQRENNTKILIGADRLPSEYSNLLVNKKIGLVINQTSTLSNGVHLLDTLSSLYNVISVFSPEHGFKGEIEAGKKYTGSKNDSSKLKFYSLYGKVKKPTKEMLAGINFLIYDIQDIGVRYYTYISTLFYVMEAAAENSIPLIILDRPNPLGGVKVEGPILKKDFKSFIGIAPIPIRYGMTVGELADYFLGESLIKNSSNLKLKIIKLKNWKRTKYYDYYYGDNWQKTSPNIPDLNTAIVYPGTGLIEGTNVSEGRGTLHPFLQIGAPFINSEKLINELSKFTLQGINFESIKFTPKSIKGMSENPKFKNQVCNGIKINITNKNKFNSVKFGIILIYTLNKLYSDEIKFNTKHFNRLIGNSLILTKIKEGTSPEIIFNSWKRELKEFKIKRKKYLIY